MSRVSMSVPQYRRCECAIEHLFTIPLSPHETEMVAVLLVTPPDRFVGYDTLVETIWPDPDTQALTARKVLHVLASRLRQKGIEIKADFGRGMFIPAAARAGREAPLAQPSLRCPTCCRQRLAA